MPEVSEIDGTSAAPGDGGTGGDAETSYAIVSLAADGAEGEAGATPFAFTVTRTGNISAAGSVLAIVTTAGGSGAAPPDVVDGEDFVGGALPSQLVTFAAGQESATLSVDVRSDTILEPDETFFMRLADAGGTPLPGGAAASATIRNDDAPPSPEPARFTLTALDTVKPEGNAGTTSLVFQVSRTGDLSEEAVFLPVVRSTFDGAAFANPADAADFALGGAELPWVVLEAGRSSTTFSIDVAGDTSVEPDESFFVVLLFPWGERPPGETVATGTILNDDSFGDGRTSYAIAAVDADKAEGDAGETDFTFKVTRTGDLSQAATILAEVASGDISKADFAGGALPSQTVTFAPGQASATLSLAVAGDTVAEPDETFVVRLLGTGGVAISGTTEASGTIRNDDDPGGGGPRTSYAIAAVDADKAEGEAGETGFTFAVTRTGDLSRAVTIAAEVAATGVFGTAPPAGVDAADFAGGALPRQTVSFAAGQASATVTVAVAGDALVEPDETFFVRLADTTGNLLPGSPEASATIRNDDPRDASDDAPIRYTLTALVGAAAEGDAGTTPLTFQVTRTGDLGAAVSLRAIVSAQGPGASTFLSTPDGADFVGGAIPAPTVTFAAGEATATLTLDIAGDTLVEPDEDFSVRLTGLSGETLTGTTIAFGAILNDDAPPTYTIAALDAVRPEGAPGETTPLTFRVTRTGDLGAPVSLAVAVSSSNGPVGFAFSPDAADFVGGVVPTPIVTLAAGQATATVTLEVAGDAVVEPDEDFFVHLTGLAGEALAGTTVATGTIFNDDVAPTYAIIALDAARAEGNSGTTPLTFRVTRTGDLGAPVSLAVAVSSSNGPVGFAFSPDAADFVGGVVPTPIVAFAAGEATATVTLAVAGDRIVEPDEDFFVQLTGLAGETLAGTTVATGTIFNDDDGTIELASYTLAALDADRPEGGPGTTTALTFQVTRTGDLGAAVTLRATVTPDSGEGILIINGATGDDFLGGALPSPLVEFAAGQATATVTLLVAGDLQPEPDEEFFLRLSGAGGEALSGTTLAVGTIRNDDTLAPVQPLLSISPLSASLAEGDSGTTAFVFRVALDRSGTAFTGPAGATWTVSRADAADFAGGVLPSGTVQISFAESFADIAVLVAGDTLVEPDESFTITLSDVTGAVLGTASATGVIRNDDLARTVGTARADTLVGTDAAEELLGQGGNDSIEGRGGDDTARGGAGDDTILGDAGRDLLVGGAGDDRIILLSPGGVRRVDGGTGFDTLELRGAEGGTLDLTAPPLAATRGIEAIALAADGPVTVVLDADAVVALSAETDTLVLHRRAGDSLVFRDSGAWRDAGPASDGLRLYEHVLLPGVQVLATDFGPAPVLGTPGPDSLVGTAEGERIEGRGGADTLASGGGDDTLQGGPGGDRYLFAGAEPPGDAVVVETGAGTDRLFFAGIGLAEADFLVVEVDAEGIYRAFGGGTREAGTTLGLLIALPDGTVLLPNQFGPGSAPVEFARFTATDGSSAQVALLDLAAFL